MRARARANISHHARSRCENATVTWIRKTIKKTHVLLKHASGSGHVRGGPVAKRIDDRFSVRRTDRRVGTSAGRLLCPTNRIYYILKTNGPRSRFTLPVAVLCGRRFPRGIVASACKRAARRSATVSRRRRSCDFFGDGRVESVRRRRSRSFSEDDHCYCYYGGGRRREPYTSCQPWVGSGTGHCTRRARVVYAVFI